jgi:uncharacterized RDD family membrane protein YckC
MESLVALNYSSFFRRLGAVLLDMLILIIPGLLIGSLIPVAGGLLVWFLYVPFLESSVLRATIGKKLMGIQVVDLSGSRITFRAAMIRALMKLVSSALLFIPHLLALFTEKRQALHDLVADTVVVYGRVEVPVADAWLEMVREVFSFPSLSKIGQSQNRYAELERLQGLRERGALSEDEFEAEKRKILDRDD